jgi:hypothetical protein
LNRAPPGTCPLRRSARAGPARGKYGTRVTFLDSPTEAAREALSRHKLLLMLHVAGNFEDDKFT